MAMFIVPGDKLMKPSKCTGGFVAKTLSLPMPTQNKLMRIYDDHITNLQPSKSSKLVYTTFGASFGDGSRVPKADYEWVWNLGHSLWGDLFVQQGLGGYFFWRVSLRTDNTWLVAFQDRGTTDKFTGKLITIATYWIDNTYQPVGIQPQSSLTDLKNRFNSVRP